MRESIQYLLDFVCDCIDFDLLEIECMAQQFECMCVSVFVCIFPFCVVSVLNVNMVLVDTQITSNSLRDEKKGTFCSILCGKQWFSVKMNHLKLCILWASRGNEMMWINHGRFPTNADTPQPNHQQIVVISLLIWLLAGHQTIAFDIFQTVELMELLIAFITVSIIMDALAAWNGVICDQLCVWFTMAKKKHFFRTTLQRKEREKEGDIEKRWNKNSRYKRCFFLCAYQISATPNTIASIITRKKNNHSYRVCTVHARVMNIEISFTYRLAVIRSDRIARYNILHQSNSVCVSFEYSMKYFKSYIQ